MKQPKEKEDPKKVSHETIEYPDDSQGSDIPNIRTEGNVKIIEKKKV